MALDADKLVNRSLVPKKVDNYYVKFLKLPENISNMLGRQVKSITRPTISIETSNTFYRGQQYVDKAKPRFNPISVTMQDDESGLTNMILYAHIMRQENVLADLYGREDVLDRDYRFDVKIEIFDSRDRMTESYTLKSCMITEIEHTQPITQGEEDNEIIIQLSYDNIELGILDQYEELKSDINF